MASTAQQAGLGVLGFLAGLTNAIEKINERNRQEQLQLLKIGAEDPRFQLGAATEAQQQPAGFFQRLAGGTPFRPTTEGFPVVPVGGGALTLQPSSAGILTRERLQGLGLTEEMLDDPSIRLFEGRPADTSTIRGLLGAIGNLRQRRRETAETRREQAEALGKIKLGLVKAARGTPNVRELVGRIRAAESMDELLEIAGEIPQVAQLSGRLQLAFMAAGEGPQAAQARQALQLLPDKELRPTTATLAAVASGVGGASPEEQQRAREALALIRELRATGVSSSRKTAKQRKAEERQRGLDRLREQRDERPPLRALPGGGVEGQGTSGLPKVRSFKRIE